MFCPVSCPFPDNEVHPPHTFRASKTNYTFAPVCHYKIYRASAISARFFAQNRRESSSCRNWAEPRRPESYGSARAGISQGGRKGGGEGRDFRFRIGRRRGSPVVRPCCRRCPEKSAPSLPRGLQKGSGAVGHVALPSAYSSYLVSSNWKHGSKTAMSTGKKTRHKVVIVHATKAVPASGGLCLRIRANTQ